MALPTPSPYGYAAIPNAGFEDGATKWITIGRANIVNESVISGSWCVKTGPVSSEYNDGGVLMEDMFPVTPGQSISLTASGVMPTGDPGTSFAVALHWYDGNGNQIGDRAGAEVSRRSVSTNQATASVTASAPAGAAYVRAAGYMNVSRSTKPSTIYMDNFSWNYNFKTKATLTQPAPNYTEADEITYRVVIEGLPNGITVANVEYFYMTYDGVDYIDAKSVGSTSDAPYAINAPALPVGQYGAYAVVTLSNGTKLTTNSKIFTVSKAAPKDTREYRASNAMTYLVGESFYGLESSIPSTAMITGAEVILGYKLEVISRAKDIGIDAARSTASVIFDITNSGTVEAVLLNKAGGSYSISGAPMTATVEYSESDFSVTEQGTSDGKKWTVYTSDEESTVVVGGSSLLFGQTAIDAPTFFAQAVGVRYVPTLKAKPAYADSGDGAVRFRINSFKLRVYFDAGSVEYYFASPDKRNVVKGTLVAGNVLSGNLKTGDASGVLQLAPELEIRGGKSGFIKAGWTIHSGYPVTDLNKIGVVADDMRYNGLPTYDQVESNRSRYLFITANFYGDPNWKSMYGVNGVDRAFAYNGEYFYKIFAHPDADKDKPRHIANHHSHLALGYAEGRVDVSVAGEPYSFDGAKGASSWAFGDSITGLLPLSGTMLGIFCQKSVWGLSGTTVDNFTSQVISPKMGAIEYTVTDMGFPVYANVYGIYTLSQTTEYGDYKGTPLSQDVSPWLRDRLQRDGTSDKEVVVAWPVRAKNQYKLAFADGYVLTMTMNFGRQQAPTFSKQKYFLTDLGGDMVEVDMYAQPSIVPAAVSSELDHTGKERIHVANKAPPPSDLPCIWVASGNGDSYLLRLGFDGLVGGEVPGYVELEVGGDAFPFYMDSDVTWTGPAEVVARYGEDATVKAHQGDDLIVLAKGKLRPATRLRYVLGEGRVAEQSRGLVDYTGFVEGDPITVRSDTGTTSLEWSDDLGAYYDPTGEYSAFPAEDPEGYEAHGVGYIFSTRLDGGYGAYLLTRNTD